MNRPRPQALLALAAVAVILAAPAATSAPQTADKTIQELNVLVQEIDREIRTAEQQIREIEGKIAGIDQQIQKNDAIIRKTAAIISQAKEKNNAPAEAVARDAQQNAQQAKKQGEETRAELLGRLKKIRASRDAARAREAAWKDDTRKLVAERLAAGRDPLTQAVLDSLNDPSKGRPFLKPFDELRAGDVLLVAPPEGYSLGALASKGLMFVDKLTSWEWGAGSSRASHSLIYLKTVNGQKLFLDDQLGEGPRIKTEEMIKNEYAGRSMDVAQPVAKIDADKLWAAARKLEVQNLAHVDQSAIGASTYNLYGDDHMVCSEASRWALIEAMPEDAPKVEETSSPFKMTLGVFFGPANFYRQPQHFLISPVEMPR